MFHNVKAARNAQFLGNEAGRMVTKDMSQSSAMLRTTTNDRFTTQGRVSSGFEAVREAFAENFVRRRELGGACCAFHGDHVDRLEEGGTFRRQLFETTSSLSVSGKESVPPGNYSWR
jgi:hypothetical protein